MGQIADVFQSRGDLDEALRIRQQEQLPVYEKLGDVRSRLVCWANIAIILLQRDSDGDRSEADRLLNDALADAQKMQLPEAGQIEKIRNQAGL